MNNEVRALEPKPLWNKFADLNEVPRPSKKEEQVIEFIKNFGNQLGLETLVDHVGNVLIRKPATMGMENRKKVVLQSHLDMVHQKNNDIEFDFEQEGIRMFVEDDWVKAEGTTLGADNGLGVATMLAILESDEIAHPALEALFTIDEETGMTGAKGLDPDFLEGEILLNLDTEEDDEIGIGCAGGVDLSAFGRYHQETIGPGGLGYKIRIKGLQGGHSGMDIIKGLGNANKLMNRVLFGLQEVAQVRVSQINGGGLRNAIPRESEATIVLDAKKKQQLLEKLKLLTTEIKSEYASLEPNLSIEVEEVELPEKVMAADVQTKLLQALYGLHNGVYRMSPEIPGLVETSNNLAKVAVSEGQIEILCLTRSSVESSKEDLVNNIRSVLALADLKVELSGDYPGWAPKKDSAILKVLDHLYRDLNGKQAEIAACHAGLECGIIGSKYPQMDMISFGPTIRGAHSPDERASISSTQKFWRFIKEVLQNIPEKQ